MADRPQPVVPRRTISEKKVRSSIEGLEGRIAPASLIDAKTLLYKDADGDMVTVKFSKPVFTSKTDIINIANANLAFTFSTGNVAAGDTTTAQQLELIDFTKLPFGLNANGLGVTITAVKNGGDGLANVGMIKAPGIALGSVTIAGDLGKIIVGNASKSTPTAITSLTVDSIGKQGTATQIQTGSPDLVSTITGALGSLKVLGDLQDARITVTDGKDIVGNKTTSGSIGSITIGGSLRGTAAVGSTSDATGLIESTENVGPVKIGTLATDGIFGGGGVSAGGIRAGGSIASVTISGSVTGGAGSASGIVTSNGVIGSVKIGGDIVGGGGEDSGYVLGNKGVTAATVHSIIAGTGFSSGALVCGQTLGMLHVLGNIDGTTLNAGALAGSVAASKITSITIDGSIIGGSNGGSGSIEVVGDLATAKIGTNLIGGTGASSGTITVHGKIGTVTVVGNVMGGDGTSSGAIISGFDPNRVGDLGTAIINGKLMGGAGDNSGGIFSGGTIGSITLGTKATVAADTVIGGGGAFSGSITSHGAFKALKITGNVKGGSGDTSGAFVSLDDTGATGDFAGDMGTVAISGTFTGGGGAHSASLRVDGDLKSATFGSIQSGTGNDSGTLHTGLGTIDAGDSGAIMVLGDFGQVAGSAGAGSASILVAGNLASLTVKGTAHDATIRAGNVIASLTLGADATNLTVSARGQAVQGKTTDLAIGKISVTGNVAGSSFLAGYDLSGTGVNPDAQIGAVTVGGNWTASNLVAGVVAGSAAGFGTALDTKAPGTDSPLIVSKIASVLIGGTVSGTSISTTDHFGFVAQFIAKFKSAGQSPALDALPDGQVFELDAANNDVSIREVALV